MMFRIAAALSLCAGLAGAETFDVAMESGANYDKAAFRLWLPDGSDTVRAVLVLVPGSNGDGRDQVDTPFWQELATRHGLALVGVYLTDKQHEDMFIEHYVDVRRGADRLSWRRSRASERRPATRRSEVLRC